MPRRIILVTEAVVDVAEAYGWYEQQTPGLGDEFLGCLEDAYALITRQPLAYPVRVDSFRRILVRRFPYAVYFEHDEKTIVVHFVFHCAQAPEKLRQRLKPR